MTCTICRSDITHGGIEDHQDDSYGGCVVCRVYVPHTEDELLSVSFPCPPRALQKAQPLIDAALAYVERRDRGGGSILREYQALRQRAKEYRER